MKEYLPEIDDLIAKILTDEATAEEQTEFRVWLKESLDNRQYFEDIQKVWHDSAEAISSIDVDTQKAWKKVQTQIHPPQYLRLKWFSTPNLLKIAAALLLLFAAVHFFNKKEAIQPQVYAAQNVVQTDTLQDGSIITLNKNTQLTTVFSKKERRVKLQGEAYFDIAANKEKPFVIEVKTMEIKVVGTEFKVDDRTLPNKVIVIVEEGIVEVKGKKETKRLTKGEKAIYDTLLDIFETSQNTDKNAMAFKTLKLEFDGTPLKKVIAQINDFYGSSVEIASPAIENCPLSAPFNLGEQTLDDVLETIHFSFNSNINIEKKEGKIYLTGKGCE